MKVLDRIKKIFEDHPFSPIILEGEKNIYLASKEKRDQYTTSIGDSYLFNKYRSNIPPGWYGFALGNPIIPEWVAIIEKALDVMIEVDPNLEIHQVKIKFGGVRFYVESKKIEDLSSIVRLIEEEMYDVALIY
jgi:hypothetical protein